jgi:hypothetical protein
MGQRGCQSSLDTRSHTDGQKKRLPATAGERQFDSQRSWRGESTYLDDLVIASDCIPIRMSDHRYAGIEFRRSSIVF